MYKGDKLLACMAFFAHSFHRHISSQLNTPAFDYMFFVISPAFSHEDTILIAAVQQYSLGLGSEVSSSHRRE
jgi:hypothetical protein